HTERRRIFRLLLNDLFHFSASGSECSASICVIATKSVNETLAPSMREWQRLFPTSIIAHHCNRARGIIPVAFTFGQHKPFSREHLGWSQFIGVYGAQGTFERLNVGARSSINIRSANPKTLIIRHECKRAIQGRGLVRVTA